MLKNLGNLLLLGSSIFCAGLIATSSLAATSEAESGSVGEANGKTVANISIGGKDKLKVSAEGKTAVAPTKPALAQPPVSSSNTKAAASVAESQQVVGANGKAVTNTSSGALAKLKVSKQAEATVEPTKPALAQPPVANSSQIAQIQNSSDKSATPASALPTSDTLSVDEDSEPDTMEQVTSVSQLKDVQPTDWAFQALQSMVERYGCISGYPDSTYRGNRALSRYEFAAGLNKCLEQIQKLIAAQPQGVTKEDLATLQRLQEQFANEIASLGRRLDVLDARTTTLEKHDFSTTSKLTGESSFSVTKVFGHDEHNNNTVLQERAFIGFLTSFTGDDLLITTLAAGNVPGYSQTAFNLAGGSAEGAVAVHSAGNTDSVVFLYAAEYQFTVAKRLRIFLDAYGVPYFFAPTLNPYLDATDLASGAISLFGQRSPIYRLGSGASLSFNYKVTDKITLTGSYIADSNNSNNPNPTGVGIRNGGLFKGGYTALGQLTWSPSQSFGIGLTYVNSYAPPGEFGFNNNGTLQLTGTGVANSLAGQANLFDYTGSPVVMNSYGAEFSFQPSRKVALNGWFGASYARLINHGDGEIFYYALGLAFPDFGKKGNLLGFVVGAEPYLTHFNGGNPQPFKKDIPLHVEGFYQYQVTPNFAITPGVIWLTAPNQDRANADDLITVLRSTFTF